MDDYLLSEKEQWEALKRWLRDNGPAIVAGVAIAALGLGGVRWWQARQDSADLAAGAMYIQMENAFEQGNRTQAFILLGDLERQYASSPYADQAKLASARAFVEDNELDRAADELRDVMQHSHDSALQLIARQRLARVQIAQRQPAQAIATLAGGDPGALAPQYDEARGDAYYAMGDKAAALTQYRLARATDVGGQTDTGLLDLKISDLAADVASGKPGAPQAAVPATATSHPH
ncbi:MAG TPA: tetratricopeptide repeat protein [Steroidobacteraceae bacterium]|nr:tetratricopeptide repeat protein [Steroidobacteraceae bacterium]